jgi:RNA polymerase sigma-70 factor (ECF subfamily)
VTIAASPEVQLARDLLAGREGAFDQFVTLFRAKLLHYSFLVCRQRDDAEEVTQEALLRVFQNLDQLKDPERVKAWVFRIARNACLMKRRKSVFAPDRELSLDELMPNSSQEDGHRKIEIADWSALPEDQAFQAELRQALDEAIAELPEKYKTVLLMRDVEELTTEETAEVLEVTTSTVKTRLHRARLAVRKSLDEFLRSSASPNQPVLHPSH